MKRMYVYILECSDISFYVGVTSDLIARMLQHSQGLDKNCYTYSRRPLTLKRYWLFEDPLSAIAFEKQLKGWSRAKKVAVIEGDIGKLKNLAKRRKK